MGIIDDYLNSTDAEASKPVPTLSSGSSLVERYLQATDEKPITRITVRPAPPISGATKSQSDEINSIKGIEGGVNPRSQDSLIGNLGSNIKSEFGAAVDTGSKGLSEVFTNKPASGVGKIGVGVLQGLTAIPSAVGDTIDYAIGKPEESKGASTGDRVSAVVGGGLPVAKLIDYAASKIPSNKAFRSLVESIGPENAGDVAARMRENPRLAPADLSPAVLSQTQKLFKVEGDAAKNYLSDTSKARMQSAGDTVTSAFDEHTGLPVNAVDKLRSLSQNAKDVGSKEINPAVKGAGAVDITNTLAGIDSVLKPGVQSVVSSESALPLSNVKKELANIRKHLASDTEMRTSAEDLHKFQAGLRRTAESLKNSTDGGSRELGNSLMTVRNNLVDDIDRASGGKYKPALANFRGEKEIAEAFTQGYEGVLTNSKKIENRPEFTKQWVEGLTEHEKEAAKEGVRLKIDTEIGVARNPALAGQNAVKSDFNREKMEMLFGKEETTKLLQKLEDERTIANTHNKIVNDSQTAFRLAADRKIDLPEKTRMDNLVPYAAEAAGAFASGVPAVGTLVYQGLRGANAAKDAIKIKLAKEHNAQLAKYALPTEGASREELIRNLEAVANKPPRQSLLSRGTNALTRIIAP